jgi:hypothetical protein
MSVRQIQAGTTDVSVTVRIVDAADGTPVTDAVFNTAGIDFWYRRDGAVSVDITEADLATPALDDAHADGGFLHISDGWYRLDLPDAACAAGVRGVQIGGTLTDMVVLAPYIELVAYNPYDVVRLGLTSLPNAAADAAGGLVISDAGGVDIDAAIASIASILADTAELQTDDIPGSLAAIAAFIDTEISSILEDTGTTIPAQIAALNNLSAAQVNAEILDAIATDTYGEPTGVPGATVSLAAKIGTLYMIARNRIDVTDEKLTVYDDSDAAEWEKDLSDDGTTYSESEANAI